MSCLTPEPVVYLIDGDLGALEAMRRLLAFVGESEGYKVHAYASAAGFLRVHDPEMPGCAVIDLDPPDMDGLAVQQALRRAGGSPAVVFVSKRADVEQCVNAMRAGAVDFLVKPVRDAALAGAVRRALALDSHERAVRRELQRIRAHLDSLTRRERQVLGQVVAGRLNKQIASDLGIAEKTIKVHRARAMEKMGAGSLAQLVREVLEVESGAVFGERPVEQGAARGNGTLVQ